MRNLNWIGRIIGIMDGTLVRYRVFKASRGEEPLRESKNGKRVSAVGRDTSFLLHFWSVCTYSSVDFKSLFDSLFCSWKRSVTLDLLIYRQKLEFLSDFIEEIGCGEESIGGPGSERDHLFVDIDSVSRDMTRRSWREYQDRLLANRRL
jgi:hypothetical protein